MTTPEQRQVARTFEFRADPSPDGRTLEGYAAIFNRWTDITDWLGEYRERIAPGAFKRTINARTPVLQFDHGTHPLIGSIPLGTISTIREDRKGLFVRARLADNWLVEPVRDAIRDGAITGMSFRFRVVDEDWSDDQAERTIKEVDMAELGPVVFPAYKDTEVAVRSLVEHMDDHLRMQLARELTSLLSGTSTPAVEPADDSDGPADEPPVASRNGTSDAAPEPAISDGPADEPPVASRIDTIRTLIAERHPLATALLPKE